jgi:hypothetical protein
MKSAEKKREEGGDGDENGNGMRRKERNGEMEG